MASRRQRLKLYFCYIEARLAKLDSLQAKGLISEGEYATKRKEISTLRRGCLDRTWVAERVATVSASLVKPYPLRVLLKTAGNGELSTPRPAAMGSAYGANAGGRGRSHQCPLGSPPATCMPYLVFQPRPRSCELGFK